MRIFQNYHRHSMYSNLSVPDSIVTNEDYAKKASEYGHGIISTMEHGTQGRYIEGHELAEKYNLKFLFGTEAYWVKDRLEKDKSNCHICLFAKNEDGRQAINDILSEANISGYYYQPRIDLDLIFSLPAKDVWVTSACVAFWKYNDDDTIKRLSDYFGYNFFLEAQSHNTDIQKHLNEHILDLSNRWNIRLIAGCDSHYINSDDSWKRDEFLASKGMHYDDEDGWYMDYPDGDTLYNRFVEQNALPKSKIEEALDNTNVFLDVGTYDNPCFNFDIKMPTLYPNLTQEEKDQKYKDLIWSQWNNKKHSVPQEKWSLYEKEIQHEIDDVITVKHADYFLLDYQIIKKGIEMGGMITDTGRGSGVSYYTNNLLGFTKVDRISSPVHMYPERFISPTRILETKSLADLDMNVANPDIFAKTQEQVIGVGHSYPMVAFGTMKPKAAWKMYARAKNVDFDIANEVSEQIDKYENALKHKEDDEEVDIYEYVDEKYHTYLKDSQEYLGIISDKKPHPCAYLIYDGDIRKEIGLITIRSQNGKKQVLCTIMDGHWAEIYKFLKNDLLKVSVVEVIKKTFKRIGINPLDENELLEKCNGNTKVWDVYKNGWTIGINQVEKNSTKHRVMKYAPQNISELCAFVAAIRPGFKSMYDIFEQRKPFSYGIPSFDNLIQTEQMHNSFLFYQEMSMAALNFAGIPMAECYGVIKNIAKKRAEKVKKYKDVFIDGFKNRIMENEHKSIEEAEKLSYQVWQIIDDSVRYQFNASHSLSVALDSLYGSYLKSTYPLYFYETFLNVLDEKGSEKERMTNAKREANTVYHIEFLPMRFRQDNRKITADDEHNAMWNSLKSLKGFGRGLACSLYDNRNNQYDDFVDFLIDMKEKGILCSKFSDLIKLNYFEEFGNNKKLLTIFDAFTNGKSKYDSKYCDKTKQKRIAELKEIEFKIPNEQLSPKLQIEYENEVLGAPESTFDIKATGYVMDVNTKYSPIIKLYGLSNGTIMDAKVNKQYFENNPIQQGEFIKILNWQRKPRCYKTDDGWKYDSTEKVFWLTNYQVINF